MKALTLLLALIVGCGSSVAEKPPSPATDARRVQAIPSDLRDSVAHSIAMGRELYVLDAVAALGTDVMLAHVPDAEHRGLAGYLPLREGDGTGRPSGAFLVSFYTRDEPPLVAYEVRITQAGKPTFQAFAPPRQATPGFAALARARQVAIDAVPKSGQPLNPLLVPSQATSEDGVVVYLLAGTTRPHLAVLGKHFRALVPLGGSRVNSLKPLSNGVLEIPTRGPNGERVEALMLSHTVSEFPLETHVFASLLHERVLYVGTRRGVWQVDGDTISFLGNEPSIKPD